MPKRHSCANKFAFAVLALGLVLLILVVTTTVAAYAQEGFKELSGTYLNKNAGVEVTFPDRWTGSMFENESYLEGMVAPGGFTEPEHPRTITLVMYVKPTYPERDPFDPSKFTNRMRNCDIPNFDRKIVSGVEWAELSVECPTHGSALRMVAVETTDKWFGLTYYAPATEFAADLGKFEATVDSLKVQGAMNATFGTGGLIKTTYSQFVTVGGKSVELKFSTSTDGGLKFVPRPDVVDAKLDEGTKTLSFRFVADNESMNDYTEVIVGTVLKGPYVVMVDDIEATSHGAIYVPGVKTILFGQSIAYPGIDTVVLQPMPGEHKITIQGTQVIPEFPVEILGAVFTGLIGVVAVVSRTRVTGHAICS